MRSPVTGILTGDSAKAEQAIKVFITVLGKHCHPEREAGAVLQCAMETPLQQNFNRSVIE